MPPHAALRLPVWQRVSWTAALGAFALCLFGLVTLGGWAWLGLPGGCVVSVIAIRTWMLRVVVGIDGLVVVNSFRTHRPRWEAIDSVVYDGGIQVRLRDNRRSIAVSAFAEPPGTLSFIVRRNERLARTLQQEVKRRQGR